MSSLQKAADIAAAADTTAATCHQSRWSVNVCLLCNARFRE
jgi:hypothetical protein